MYWQVTYGHLNATKVSADLVLNEYTLFKTILAERSKKQKDPEFNDPEWYYPLEEQINALEEDQFAWEKWMKARSVVSSTLDENLRNQYDNLTNNIRRRKLIDLKNRYEGFGMMSEYQYEMILKYDCTDKELADHKYE